MPLRMFQVRLIPSGALPEDHCINVLYYDTAGVDSDGGVADAIKAAYDASDLFSSAITSMQIRWYEITGGQPLGQKNYSFTGSGAALMREVALCLSYAAVDNPDLSTARRRGRIYLGPLQANLATGERPSGQIIASALTLGEALASVGSAFNTTWKMWSKTDQVASTIESIWVDNAWDSQRRRGLKPTGRTTRDVQ